MIENDKGGQRPVQNVSVVTDLRPYDIVCGKHQHAYNHTGNRRFRVTISMFISAYTSCSNRVESRKVINKIEKTLKDAGARFLKEQPSNSGKYVEVSQRQARNKIQQ